MGQEATEPTRRWWGQDVTDYLKELEVLHEYGWHVGLAGSVAKNGIGRDLDLILVPTYATAVTHEQVFSVIEKDGWELVTKHMSEGVPGDLQVVVWTGEKDDRFIDFCLAPEPSEEARREAYLEYDLAEQGLCCGD